MCPVGGTCGILARASRVVARVVPVRAPLPHIAGDVVEPEAVRRERVDGRGSRETIRARVRTGEAPLEDVHAMRTVGLELVAPRKRTARTATRRVLPLCLG